MRIYEIYLLKRPLQFASFIAELHCKRLPYSSDHNKITKFEDFHHKMLKFPYFINLLCSEITLFWDIECISLSK